MGDTDSARMAREVKRGGKLGEVCWRVAAFFITSPEEWVW